MLRYVIVDLEATCWERSPPFPHEIIEIGAVCFEPKETILGEFQTFVLPLLCPVLSEFCTRLTHIEQHHVDGAPDLPTALRAFVDWTHQFGEIRVASWGAFDYQQFLQDCSRHGVEYPFGPHLNLKKAFSAIEQCRPQGMRGALMRCGLGLAGTHHRGLDDARNISRILGHLTQHHSAEQIEAASLA